MVMSARARVVLLALALMPLGMGFDTMEREFEWKGSALTVGGWKTPIQILGEVLPPKEEAAPKPTPIGIWEDTVSKSPLKARPRVNLARAYQLNGYTEAAMRNYDIALQLTTLESNRYGRQMTRQIIAVNVSQMMIESASYLLNHGDPDMAVKQIQYAEGILVRIWNEEPGFPGIAANLGMIYVLTSRYEQAVQVLSTGIEMLPSYGWYAEAGKLYQNRGSALQQLGRCDEANADFKAAATIDRDIFDAKIPPCTPKENSKP